MWFHVVVFCGEVYDEDEWAIYPKRGPFTGSIFEIFWWWRYSVQKKAVPGVGLPGDA